VVAVAVAVVVATAAVVVADTAGVPAGSLNQTDSDYRCARLEEADGRVGDSPKSRAVECLSRNAC
jgi:acid phosphatase family membrane protein YuiD